MAGAIAYVLLPNIGHHLCLWHIYLNAAKHLGHVISASSGKFLGDLKRCMYEDRSESEFNNLWDALLTEYCLRDNNWMVNLYSLREKWSAVYCDSFTMDMTMTPRNKAMNNVFKKDFIRNSVFQNSCRM
jgi:zinc finger SWIM domain-containing protein 3